MPPAFKMKMDSIMKKIILSLAAVAALSTAALAENRSYDLRDSDTYFGKYSTQVANQSAASNALAVTSNDAGLTNFERVLKISAEREHGGH